MKGLNEHEKREAERGGRLAVVLIGPASWFVVSKHLGGLGDPERWGWDQPPKWGWGWGGGGGQLDPNYAQMCVCVCPQVKDMGPLPASSEWN